MGYIEDFCLKMYQPAINMESTTKVPHLFTMAQAALESGWGRYAIGNNFFGHTCQKTYTGMKQLVKTTENLKVDLPIGAINDPNFVEILEKKPLANGSYLYTLTRWFKDYPSLQACLEDHFKILSQPNYKNAFLFTNDLKKFAEEIQEGGYATAPNYATQIVQVAQLIQKSMPK